MKSNTSIGAEAWIFFGACIALLVAYFAPVSGEVGRLLGVAVAVVGVFFAVRYAIGDNNGRNWRGSFLPAAIAIAGLKLFLT
jgi:hypothetical protein